MTIKVLETRVRRITAEIVVLGWSHRSAEDLKIIERAISRYVSTAHLEGFNPKDMLQDVLDKYRTFFMGCGDVDVVERDNSKIVVFYLRARKGL
jgi:hypothetical protein